MALIADFMLVWLPAPTISMRPPLAITVGPIAKYFHGFPDNAFQIALVGTSYSFLQRVGAIVRNGAKLFVVETSASLIGTSFTNLLINVRKALDKSYAVEAEDVPILSMSVAYGVYMAVSSNLSASRSNRTAHLRTVVAAAEAATELDLLCSPNWEHLIGISDLKLLHIWKRRFLVEECRKRAARSMMLRRKLTRMEVPLRSSEDP